MKLQSKLALFNAISKVLIIIIFVIIMPVLVNHIAIINTDRQLKEKKDQVLEIIKSAGISSFIEEDSQVGYGSYNLLKEEFISLELVDSVEQWMDGVENSERLVEDEIVNYRVLSYTFEQSGHQYLLEIGRSLSTITDIAAALRKFGFYTLLTILLLTVVTDIAYVKYLLKPLQQIIEKLRATKDPSSFHFETIGTSTIDFKYLDSSIHEMMSRIETVFLKEREFISNVSHELLTPISILQSKLENMLSSEGISDENVLRLVEAQKTINRLKNIIKALLLISKIENEQYLKTDTLRIASLVDEVVEEIEDRFVVKNLQVRKEIEADYTLRACNKALLFNMIFNIINNAIKYNKEDGSIIIRGYRGSKGYVLEINDTGVGMEQENIPFIFSRFKRLQKNDNESFGLGLPIVKTIADFHQVEIEVVSKLYEGSSFRLLFK